MSLLFCFLLAADVTPKKEATPTIKADVVRSIEGYYKVKGSDRGKPYTGVVILKKEGKVYTISYLCGYNHLVAVGVQKDDTISFGWATEKGGCGVTVMTLKDFTWTGSWTSLPGTLSPQPEQWEYWGPLEDIKDNDE